MVKLSEWGASVARFFLDYLNVTNDYFKLVSAREGFTIIGKYTFNNMASLPSLGNRSR